MTQKDSPTNHDDHVPFGHEADHSNARMITLAVGGLAALAVGAVIAVWGIGMLFRPPAERDLLAAPAPVTPRPAVRGTLNPRQPEALSELRAREEMRLNTYGWVDREGQVARIPIARAMQLVAERGVPAWAPPSSPDDANAEPQAAPGAQEAVEP